MIMENFKKFSLDEQQDGGPNLGAGISSQLSSGPGASIRAQLAAKKAAEAKLTPEVRKKIKAMAGKISSTSLWNRDMLQIDSVKDFLSTQFDSKDAREVLDAINNNHGNIENGWQMYRRYILKDQNFWNKILLKVYPVFSDNWVKNNLNNFLDKELKKRAEELDNKFDSLDYFDGTVAIGSVRRLAELCIEWALGMASYNLKNRYLPALERGFSVSPAPAELAKQPTKDQQNVAPAAQPQFAKVAGHFIEIAKVADAIGITMTALAAELKTTDGQNRMIDQLEGTPGSKELISIIDKYVRDFVNPSADSIQSPTEPAAAPTAAPADATATTATTATTAAPAATTTTAATSATTAPAAAVQPKKAPAATGSRRVDTRRARIARQAMGERRTSDAVTKLQALLVNAGYSVSELGGKTSFAPAPGRVQEVVNNLSEFKNFNNIWDRWLISEKVQPKDYANFGIDGKYGEKTIDAVRRFQQDIVKKYGEKAKLGKTGPARNGVDGTMGKMTWAYLQKVAKGEIELPKTSSSKKTASDKKNQSSEDKNPKDNLKAAYTGTNKFLKEIHKIVNNAIDRGDESYKKLRDYTKNNKSSGPGKISIWNDPIYWKHWIEGNTEAVKKIYVAAGGKNFDADISASMPRDAARAKLIKLLRRHSKEVDAYIKARKDYQDFKKSREIKRVDNVKPGVMGVSFNRNTKLYTASMAAKDGTPYQNSDKNMNMAKSVVKDLISAHEKKGKEYAKKKEKIQNAANYKADPKVTSVTNKSVLPDELKGFKPGSVYETNKFKVEVIEVDKNGKPVKADAKRTQGPFRRLKGVIKFGSNPGASSEMFNKYATKSDGKSAARFALDHIKSMNRLYDKLIDDEKRQK